MRKMETEVERVTEYVEATIQNIGQKIGDFIGKGLAYDLTVLKDGVEIHHVPVAVASALIVVSTLPPIRLGAFLAMTGASMGGYTFRLKEKPLAPKK